MIRIYELTASVTEITILCDTRTCVLHLAAFHSGARSDREDELSTQQRK